jgi:hypothetical protein
MTLTTSELCEEERRRKKRELRGREGEGGEKGRWYERGMTVRG